MKTNILFAFFLIGCGGLEAVEETQSALGGFSFDSTALTPAPTGALPGKRLTQVAFGDGNIRQRLIQSSEAFKQSSQIGSRVGLDSPGWRYELDATRGHVLAIAQVESGPAVAQDETQLQTRALSRLAAWGLPSTEIGPVWQRHAMRQDRDAVTVGTPVIDGYKTFAIRAINGIVVEGHRAVITHAADGSFRRALVKWPALAATGHLLHTQLTPAQIEDRARTALAQAGEASGAVTLRWKYVPKYTPTGEITLTLRAAARLPSVKGAEATEEPREIDVDVSAIQ